MISGFTAKQVGTALFRVITQQVVVISYLRFTTTRCVITEKSAVLGSDFSFNFFYTQQSYDTYETREICMYVYTAIITRYLSIRFHDVTFHTFLEMEGILE